MEEQLLNKEYIKWLASWIQNKTVNIQTGKPFVLNDIKDIEYKAAVKISLKNNGVIFDAFRK